MPERAHQDRDCQTAAIALGYTTHLAHTQDMTAAALNHLSTAFAHAQHAPTVAAWLASIQATICADSGDHTTAAQALDCAQQRPVSQVRSRCHSSTTASLTCSLPPATFTSKPATRMQREPRSSPRLINFQLRPAVAASSRSLPSPQQSCARVISPTPAATPSPPPTFSTAPLT